MEQKKIDRINELARKAKTPEGLTPEELSERDVLRREYIDSYKRSHRPAGQHLYPVSRRQQKEAGEKGLRWAIRQKSERHLNRFFPVGTIDNR